MTRLLISIFVILSFGLNSQAQPQTLQSFIPADYSILDSASGDINKDSKKDILIILKSNQEENTGDTGRPLLVLLGSGKELYELAARSDSVVLCKACGGVFGDPYAGMTVKNNFFSIEHYGGSNWRWTRIITFRYDLKTGKIYLHKDAGESFHVDDPDKTRPYAYSREDYGKLLFSKYSYDKIWRQ